VHWDPEHQQSQQSHHYELMLQGNKASHVPTCTWEAENNAGQSGLNWPCFDQMLEVPTSSTFLLMFGVLVDQFSMLLGHWEGLMQLHWQGVEAKCEKCTQCAQHIKMCIVHRIVHSRPSMHVQHHH